MGETDNESARDFQELRLLLDYEALRLYIYEPATIDDIVNLVSAINPNGATEAEIRQNLITKLQELGVPTRSAAFSLPSLGILTQTERKQS